MDIKHSSEQSTNIKHFVDKLERKEDNDASNNNNNTSSTPPSNTTRSSSMSSPAVVAVLLTSAATEEELIELQQIKTYSSNSEDDTHTKVEEERHEVKKYSKIKSRDFIDDRKIFVGGLPWDTNFDILNDHFSQFGKIVSCRLMIDPLTNQPRGFGFIRFIDRASQVECLKHKNHRILGRLVDVKHAIPKRSNNDYDSNTTSGGDTNNYRATTSTIDAANKSYQYDHYQSGYRLPHTTSSSNNTLRDNNEFNSINTEGNDNNMNFYSSGLTFSNESIASTNSTTSIGTNTLVYQEQNIDSWNMPAANKLFLGGLNPAANDSTLYKYFSQFEGVIDAFVMVNRDTCSSRGFGFVSFCTAAQADIVLSHHPHVILGKPVDVKPAERRVETLLPPPTSHHTLHQPHHRDATTTSTTFTDSGSSSSSSSSSSSGSGSSARGPSRRVGYRESYHDHHDVQDHVYYDNPSYYYPSRSFDTVDNGEVSGGRGSVRGGPDLRSHPLNNDPIMSHPSYQYYTAAYYGGNAAYAYPHPHTPVSSTSMMSYGGVMPGFYHSNTPSYIPPQDGYHHINYSDDDDGGGGGVGYYSTTSSSYYPGDKATIYSYPNTVTPSTTSSSSSTPSTTRSEKEYVIIPANGGDEEKSNTFNVSTVTTAPTITAGTATATTSTSDVIEVVEEALEEALEGRISENI